MIKMNRVALAVLAVGFALLIAHAPQNAANQQFMKRHLTPGCRVVAISGVKHPALALLAHPGPGLLVAQHKHRATILIVVAMDIGFVFGYKAFKTAHHRVVFLPWRYAGGRAGCMG